MKAFSLLIALTLGGIQAQAQLPTISDKTSSITLTEGYFDYYFDNNQTQLLLKVDKLNEQFLYVNYLAAGVGSNDIGLDRSQQGGERIVFFEKRGPKLFLIQPNLSYIARSQNALEKKSVEEAFASSVLYAFPILAEEDGAYLIDVTPFFLRDAHGVTERLSSRGEGAFTLDKDRSTLYEEGIFNFPKNSEFETILTFAGKNPGPQVRSVVPSPTSITVRQHHSFVELPDDGYTPRVFDPRAGYYPTSFMDYASPIDKPMMIQYINRHRLEKKDPNAEMSEPIEPIVYYLDNGTPEPVRTALLEGARWWNQAFEAAGYIDAFQVKVLPDDAHPLDIRYNVINWVHRSTRGWSYGGSVVDPRTGEIIKGNVLLGSLRVRQDYMIASGLLAPFDEGDEQDPRMMEMALSRIRQLSAHEIGHTLGIYHNFASSVNNRASVMDYPHPKVDIINGQLSLENAYDEGIGEWDKRTILYGYQEFPEGIDESYELRKILENTATQGLLYISDNDARPAGGAHPYAHLWEYGDDPTSQLSHILEVRDIALRNFGEAVIPMGTPMTYLEDVLVPIYLFHRYQLEATVKLIGGYQYSYNVRGDNQLSPSILDDDLQRKALKEMIKAVDPNVLALPESILDLIPPRPAGIPTSRELFRGNTGPSLDALSMAQTAADAAIGLLLHPQRANRLVEFNARENTLGLEEVIETLLGSTWEQSTKTGYQGAIAEVVNFVVVSHMIELHTSSQANPLTKAKVLAQLERLLDTLEERKDPMAKQASLMIDSYFENPSDFEIPSSLPAPPGSPIGSDLMMCGY